MPSAQSPVFVELGEGPSRFVVRSSQSPGIPRRSELLHLLLGLLPRHLRRIVDQQAEDLGIIHVALPQLLRERLIAAGLGPKAASGRPQAAGQKATARVWVEDQDGLFTMPCSLRFFFRSARTWVLVMAGYL